MKSLFAPGFSVTRTRRRRFLWAVWWSAPPCREPFRKPDASQGGVRTLDEARQAAEQAAKRPLVELDAAWARAWGRVLQGERPWSSSSRAERPPRMSHPATERESVWKVLGLTSKASVEEVKRAYRQGALELHPDRGGNAASFHALHAAYEEALSRLARRKT